MHWEKFQMLDIYSLSTPHLRDWIYFYFMGNGFSETWALKNKWTAAHVHVLFFYLQEMQIELIHAIGAAVSELEYTSGFQFPGGFSPICAAFRQQPKDNGLG